MHIAEVVTIAKSLPLLRLNTYKSLILSYSADYRRIFLKNPGTRAKSSERYFAISEAEIEAYKMQYSYRPESLPISVANISIIDVHYVGSIKDPNGGYGYPMIKDYSDFLKSQQKFKNK